MRFISILTAITLAFGALTMSVSAAESGKSGASAQQSVSENAVLEQKEWDGRAKFKADTCYFVKKNASVTLSGSRTLPASSMIVVENGGKLTVKKGAKLYAKGAVIVHSGGKLAVDGMAVFKSGSAGVINGKMTVGSSGRLSVYGDIQISKDGPLGIRGRAALHGDGRLLSWGTVKKLAKSARVPAYTKRTDEMPLYYAEECSQYLDSSVTMFS